jgi:diketogulonate reductase-like aldo/keto reductase
MITNLVGELRRYTDMELKELGDSGVMVPEIGVGTWKYTGGIEPLRRGIALGAFLIDTAEMYRPEDVVG